MPITCPTKTFLHMCLLPACLAKRSFRSRTFNLSCHEGRAGTNAGENTATGEYRFYSVARETLIVNVATIKVYRLSFSAYMKVKCVLRGGGGEQTDLTLILTMMSDRRRCAYRRQFVFESKRDQMFHSHFGSGHIHRRLVFLPSVLSAPLCVLNLHYATCVMY